MFFSLEEGLGGHVVVGAVAVAGNENKVYLNSVFAVLY